MYVGVFADPGEGERAKRVMVGLRNIHIKSTGITITEAWINDGEATLLDALETTTHLLLLLSSTTIPGWALHVIGFARGRRIPVFATVTDLPEGLSDVRCVSVDAIDNTMLAERSIWEQQHRIELARTRLGGRAMDPDAFYKVALEGDRARVEDFLVSGQSPDTRSSAGVPVLVGAVRGRSSDVVQQLIGAGCDPNAICGADGTTALCEAASIGLGTIAGVLLARNADPNHVTGNGQTALMLAASQGRPELVERLLSAGADPATRDSLGMDAIAYAKLFDRAEIVSTLEKFGSS